MTKLRSFPQKLFKLTMLVSIFLITSCSDENEGLSTTIENSFSPKIENGRLVFKSGKHYNEFIADPINIQNFVKESNGFTPLRNRIQGNEESYADFVLDLYNTQRELQIGNDIVFIKDWTQYFISNKNEQLLLTLKENLKNKKVTNHTELTIYPIKREIIPVSPEGTNTQARWLDARYQREVRHPSYAAMKFVFEAYLNTYYTPVHAPIGQPKKYSVTIDTGVRSKYEWLHGRTWKPAGEIVSKEITGLSIRLVTHSKTFQRTVPYVKQVDNRNLIVRGPRVTSIAGRMNYTLYISGRFKSVDTQKPQTMFYQYRFEYDTNCSWSNIRFVI